MSDLDMSSAGAATRDGGAPGSSDDFDRLSRRSRAQFGEMLAWLGRGWRPAAQGFRCRECGGPQWWKAFGRRERFQCVKCGVMREYLVE